MSPFSNLYNDNKSCFEYSVEGGQSKIIEYIINWNSQEALERLYVKWEYDAMSVLHHLGTLSRIHYSQQISIVQSLTHIQSFPQ